MPHLLHRLLLTRGAIATLVLLGLLLAAPPPLSAAEPAPSPAPFTSIQAFWNLTVEERSISRPYRIEADITYFDADWGHLWLQDRSAGAYFSTGSKPLPLMPGQRIVAEGILPAGGSLTLAGATITVVGTARTAPIPANRQLHNVDLLNDQLVVLDAHVDRQVLADSGHLHLFLSADGEALFAWLLLPPGETVPQLARTNVRLKGVFAIQRSTAGEASTTELKIQREADIQILSRLEDDPRFTLPISTLSSLTQKSPDTLVHIVGSVRAQEPGQFIRLRDDTGQIDVPTGQTLPCHINELVEAVGYPSINGTDWRLLDGLYRPFRAEGGAAPAAAGAGLPELRTTSRILELDPAEAARGYPVAISGVVTWSHPDAPFLFLQDSSGGICVQRGSDTAKTRAPGRRIEVRGVTAMGEFAPIVVATTIGKTGDTILPKIVPISLEQALTGNAEALWVEMRGFVRHIHRGSPWTRLEMATAAGDFEALLPAADELPSLTGAIVRIRGVCTATPDQSRRIRGIQLWVPSPEQVQIEEEPPKDLFGVPVQSLSALGRFGAPQSSDRRVRVDGVVLFQSPGHWVQIQDGEVSLRVLTHDDTAFSPGQRVETVGFLSRQGGRTILREAVCRAVGLADQPAALPFSGAERSAAALDGALVFADARLLDTSTIGGETRLTLQSAEGIFEASYSGLLDALWPAQSQVRLTGLMDVSYDERARGAGFRVRLRSPADLVLRERPSWFTRERILGLTTALGFGALLALIWVAALRRRVHQQTGQIRQQLQREASLEAELQRATRLESLGLLAGGIAHDFNNLLTVVMGNLSIASLDADLRNEPRACLAEASRAIGRARDLTQQLLTFAKGGTPVRSAVALPFVVREVAEFVLRGTAVRCEFHFALDLWPADADKGQISQVVQNIVINALQAMADGGVLRVHLINEEVGGEHGQLLPAGRYLKLSIGDTGRGIHPEILPRIFDPYFTTKKEGSGIGLATVYSIVRKHGGHITVESAIGRGTTFHIWVPAASTQPTDATAAPGRGESAVSGRVLLMDDEPAILQLASYMLHRVGLQVTTALDGAAAIREYELALAKGQAFDLVILDLTIPGGMGGLQTFHHLHELDPDVVAIVSSGYSDDQGLASYQARGFRGMLAKPYDYESLAAVVRQTLSEHPRTD